MKKEKNCIECVTAKEKSCIECVTANEAACKENQLLERATFAKGDSWTGCK